MADKKVERHDSDQVSSGEPDDPLYWRFTLVRLEDRSQPRYFASLEELVAHLCGLLSRAAKDDGESSADMLNHFEQRKR